MLEMVVIIVYSIRYQKENTPERLVLLASDRALTLKILLTHNITCYSEAGVVWDERVGWGMTKQTEKRVTRHSQW